MKFAFLLFLGVVAAQTGFGTRPPNAGAAEWAASLRYDPADGMDPTTATASWNRHVSLVQSPIVKEWESLGTSFTIEFQFSMDPPVSDPFLGRWNQIAANSNETKFLPLINRHPGMTLNNEWSHFNAHIIRTSEGCVLVAWAGCGCASKPEMVNGSQPNLQTCGFGYLLHSDNIATSPSKFYIIPGQWYHVSISFDGDGTEPDTYKSKVAKMYINGKLILSNNWNHPSNNPGRYNVCEGRPMQWFRSGFGLSDEVRLGYLDNQDGQPERVDINGVPLNEFQKYGIDGYIDEVRIWKDVRSDKQIEGWWDLTMEGEDRLNDKTLVAYYDWNRLPPTEDPMRRFPNEVTVNHPDPQLRGSPWGTIHSFPIPTADDVNTSLDYGALWQNGNSRTGDGKQTYAKRDSKVTIIAKRQETSTGPIENTFIFRGLDPDPSSPSVSADSALGAPALFPPFETFKYQIFDFSEDWENQQFSGKLRLTRTTNGDSININTIYNNTFQRNETLTVELDCADASCTNLIGDTTFRDWWIMYYAIVTPVPTNNAMLYFNIESECDGHYDVCGVCNGRNETCQCVVYNNFRNVRMAYVLLTFMLDYLVEQIDHTKEIMGESLELVSKPNFRAADMSEEVEEQIKDLMKFYNGCLENYCDAVYNFNDALSKLPAISKRDDEGMDEFPAVEQQQSVPVVKSESSRFHNLAQSQDPPALLFQ